MLANYAAALCFGAFLFTTTDIMIRRPVPRLK